MRAFILVVALNCLFPLHAFSLPAFPGAEGYGSDTVGGRGGAVIEVVNLNADGDGSLRAACSAAGPRIVVFRVGGIIELGRDISIREPYITIAGQTAPGDGIMLKGAALTIETHDVIVRGLRVRVGDHPSGPNPDNRDGIGIANNGDPPHNIILDHCSISWAIDENLSVWYPAHDITIQWCIISEGLHDSLHPKGPHSMGLLVGPGGRRVSIHHNLFAHNHDRNPLMSPDTESEIINNVAYNWMWGTATNLHNCDEDPPVGPTLSNVIGNYYKEGPSNQSSLDMSIRIGACWSNGAVYVQGNVGPGRPADTGDEWSLVENDAGEGVKSVGYALTPSGITTQPVLEALELVLTGAGATVPVRDGVDARVVQSVRDGTGAIIDSQDEVGGWPVFNGGTPPADGDHDGMPDSWEIARGLDPGDPSDGAQDRNADGYTNVEEYINGLFSPDDTPRITVSAPNGGERWSTGIVYDINWTTNGPIDAVKIEYSTDGGVTFSEIIGATANNGSYAWLVPDTPGTNCLLKISEATDGEPSDVSNGVFSIVGSVFSQVPHFGDRLNYTESTPSRWSVDEDRGDLRYFLNTSDYEGRPGEGLGELAVVKDRTYSDFELTLVAKSAEDLNTNTAADYCLVFGYQDAQNYWYLMLNSNANLSQLFRVTAGVRQTISDVGEALIKDNDYHFVSLKCEAATITLQVDGAERFRLDDLTWATGAVGVGSFNDSVWFDDIDITELGPAEDDGGDGGADAGADAGADTGRDAGTDAGNDAGAGVTGGCGCSPRSPLYSRDSGDSERDRRTALLVWLVLAGGLLLVQSRHRHSRQGTDERRLRIK